jgi:predicted nucleotidyltransferase
MTLVMNLQMENIICIREYFKNQPVLKAYLFGSAVRSDFSEKSDIDILVELDYSAPIGLAFYQMGMDLEKLTNRKIDLVSVNGVSRRILPFIENEKILIYERKVS